VDIRHPSGEFHRKDCRFRADLGGVTLRARVRKQCGAAHGETATGERAVDDRRGAQEFALSLLGRDPADAADARRGAPALDGSRRPSHTVIDHRHALARDKPRPRLRHESARCDNRGIRAVERLSCYPSRQTRGDVAVGMKNHGQAQSHDRGQQPRAIHVNQIGLFLFHQ